MTSQMNVIVIEDLVKLVFNLLGKMPDHWRRKSPYADRFWKLNGHRRLSYTQTDEQKSHLIIINYLVKAKTQHVEYTHKSRYC